MSIKNERLWPGLMYNVFFKIVLMVGWVCIVYLRDGNSTYYRMQCHALINITMGPGIHVDHTLTCTTYRNIITDQIHPSIDGGGLFQQYSASCHSAKTVKESLRYCTGLQIPQISI